MGAALRLMPTAAGLGTDFRCAIMNESAPILACIPLCAPPLGEGALRCSLAWAIMKESAPIVGFGLLAAAARAVVPPRDGGFGIYEREGDEMSKHKQNIAKPPGVSSVVGQGGAVPASAAGTESPSRRPSASQIRQRASSSRTSSGFVDETGLATTPRVHSGHALFRLFA